MWSRSATTMSATVTEVPSRRAIFLAALITTFVMNACIANLACGNTFRKTSVCLLPTTITYREIQTAVSLLIPGQLLQLESWPNTPDATNIDGLCVMVKSDGNLAIARKSVKPTCQHSSSPALDLVRWLRRRSQGLTLTWWDGLGGGAPASTGLSSILDNFTKPSWRKALM